MILKSLINSDAIFKVASRATVATKKRSYYLRLRNIDKHLGCKKNYCNKWSKPYSYIGFVPAAINTFTRLLALTSFKH